LKWPCRCRFAVRESGQSDPGGRAPRFHAAFLVPLAVVLRLAAGPNHDPSFYLGTMTAMATANKKKPTRQELGSDQVLCDFCPAKCCRYFALPIETPEKRKDFEFIRWYLLHERASIFTEDEDWYLLVHTRCKHLGEDNRCGIYSTRPQICRDYSTDNCEYDDEWCYERYFETPEQIHEYAEALLQKRGQSIRSPQPPSLPVIG
jgi:Fe-S-cluster containining protein